MKHLSIRDGGGRGWEKVEEKYNKIEDGVCVGRREGEWSVCGEEGGRREDGVCVGRREREGGVWEERVG